MLPAARLLASCGAHDSLQLVARFIRGSSLAEVVMPDVPDWEAQYRQWAHQRRLDQAFYKIYPSQKTHKPVPSTTGADSSGDTRTMKRRLKERVFLLVKTPQGTWQFPQAAHASGETVRDTAARALQEAIGKEARLHFIGNAPMAHVQPSTGGTPVFFLLSQVLQDPWPVRLQAGAVSDFAWVTKGELRDYIKDAEYCTIAEQML